MKRIIKYFSIILILACAFVQVEKAGAQGGEVSFQVFYDQLSPYGQWVDFPEEGYVWIPNVEPGFSPYSTRGYWAYTDYGWTWVSDYQWGWAPFHYGRWDFDDDYGWYWVPDYQWSPAWVAWSRSPGYYGWAPLRPGIEVNAAITEGYYVPYEHWCYVHEEYLGHRDMDNHYAPRSENATHIRNSTMINHTYIDNARHTTYIGGPPRGEVEKSTHAPVQQYAITPRSTPGQSVTKSQVRIYRPEVVKATSSNPNPAPPRLTNLKDIKPLAGRTPSPERLNNAPSTPVVQPEQRGNPINTIPPQARQNDRTTSQPPSQTNRIVTPEQRPQVIPPQQTAPRDKPQQQAPLQNNRNVTPDVRQQTAPPTSVQQSNRNTTFDQRQQPVQQRPAPQRDRPDRYAPPQYQAPKSNTPVQHTAPTPRVEAPRQAPPQNQMPPSRQARPQNQRAQPQHQAPAVKTPHQ